MVKEVLAQLSEFMEIMSVLLVVFNKKKGVDLTK